MKKTVLCSVAICLLLSIAANAQIGNFIKKATKSVTNEVLGNSGPDSGKAAKSQPEPSCACDNAELIVDLAGKLQIDYKEYTISILPDGRILLKHNYNQEYYVVKDGVAEGPFKAGDQKVAEFEPKDEESTDPVALYTPYVSRSGDKYLITFGGKKYGPYAKIDKFLVTISKDKFAAIVTETVAISDKEAEKMEQEVKNAKTQQEQMDLSMKYAQMMQQKMMAGGGPQSITPKLVTNIPNVTYNPMTNPGIRSDVKYDEFVVVSYDKIQDLNGKTLIGFKPEYMDSEKLYLNSTNTKYAVMGYDGLLFSDGTTMTELFGTRLVKSDGKAFLAYMYYSPKRNAIMQCKIPF